MTLQFRQDLQALLRVIGVLADEARKQGVDNTGYHQFIEAVRVDEVVTAAAVVQHELTKAAKKHGDFRYIPKGGA